MTLRDKTPVILLTGFLGSGKTTLLNQLLSQTEFADTLVIINEFGEIGLDHLLVEESSDTILELSNGCLCCSVRGDLVDTLLQLDRGQFRRIIIETTGIADPVPVYQSLAAHPELVSNYQPASIVTVFDCERGQGAVLAHPEAQRQIAMADFVYLSKQVRSDQSSDHAETIREHNQLATIVDSPDKLTIEDLERPISKEPVSDNLAPANHAYQSTVLKTDRELTIPTVSGLLHYLAMNLGENLLRAKGLVRVSEHPDRPLVVHASGSIIHDFETLPCWPDPFSETRLVLITNSGTCATAQSIFDGFVGNLAVDTADHEALTDNPLSVPGFRF